MAVTSALVARKSAYHRLRCSRPPGRTMLMEGYRPGRWSLDSEFGGARHRSLVWRRSIHAELPIKVASMLEKSREGIAGADSASVVSR